MGQVLPAPISSKSLERWGTPNMRIGSTEMQGYRLTMEDTHTIKISLSKKHPNKSLFAVFDGHGGSKASIFLKDKLGEEIGKLDDPLNKDSLTKCMQELDSEFLKGKDDRENGSTSVFAVLDPKSDTTWRGIVANLGDSRAIIVRSDGTCESLTKDHKPSNKDEEERIQAAGGFVRANRVDGQLAMSRAIGDSKYKDNLSLAMDKQKVIAVPEFQEFEIRKGDSLLLYCDGVVEQMTNEDVATFLVGELKELDSKKESPDPAMILAKLLDYSLEKGSKDNMSALMIMFMDGSTYERKKHEFIPGPFNAFKGDESFRTAYLADAKKFGYEGDELMQLVKKTEAAMPKGKASARPPEPKLGFQDLIQTLGLTGPGEEKAKQLLGALLRPALADGPDTAMPDPPELSVDPPSASSSPVSDTGSGSSSSESSTPSSSSPSEGDTESSPGTPVSPGSKKKKKKNKKKKGP